MIRKGFVMSIFPGQAEEYLRRHNPIWPELEAALKEHGVLNYSIFPCAPTRQLFAYVELEDERKWDAMAETDICRKWWAHMKDIMPTNSDNSPVSLDLQEVFHIEQ